MIGAAIDKAMDEMPEDFEIREFMTANRAEVKNMCLTEYNEAETMEMMREDGRREGREEGREEAVLLNIKNLMDSTGWTVDKIMDMLKIPQEQRSLLYGRLAKNPS